VDVVAGSTHAYKTLINGRSLFTGFHWPLPTGSEPGEWVEAPGPVALCTNGIHAATTAQLPQWLGDDVWTIELDGEVVETEAAVIGSRARLIGRVEQWDDAARAAFAESCAERAREVVARWPQGGPLLQVIEQLTTAGRAAAVGYWTAVVAGESATGRRIGPDYDAAFAREREAQAAWLASELGL
jgi:hypothetical protein